MPAYNQGTVTYPGIQSWEDFRIEDQHGIQPAVASMKVFPQFGLPDENGDLVMSYNENTITFKNCHIDSAQYEQGSGGQVVVVRFLDERWTWSSAAITGHYNFRLPNNWVDPLHEKTPQELASLCFQALGVAIYDVANLPNDSRPEVDWNRSNPAQELEKLCSELGCRIVPVRSIGGWSIQVAGVGQDLPDGYPYQDPGQGIDPKETPDYIRIVTAPIRYQVMLPLKPRGKDLDLSYKPLELLSYAPNPQTVSAGFGEEWQDFQNLATLFYRPPNSQTGYLGSERVLLPDGTKVSAMELAQDSIFKCWGLDFADQPNARQLNNGEWAIAIPGLNGVATVRQIVLTNKLVQTYTDNFGAQHERAAFVCGTFFGEKADGGNYPDGTRIDKQYYASDQGMDERASFSLSLDPIDNYRSIIAISKPMVSIQSSPGASEYTSFSEAKLRYACAIHVRDPETWQPLRYDYYLQIGSGTNQDFCRVVIKDDIQPWVIGDYDSSGRPLGTLQSNYDEVQQQCQYYAESIAREYTAVTSETRSYIGLYPIDLDGAIQQVTYSIDKSGATTTVSRGTEHSWITPSFEERRQQVARQGISQRVEYAKYEIARRAALKGNVNT